MAEMIVPGTYIEVRAEGLISAGRIATGVVGVVGTAKNGPIGEPTTLAGFSQAQEIFGPPDDFQQPEDGADPLTLVRVLSLLYNNGASSVVAVRVASASRASATFSLRDDAGNVVAGLTAKTPGTWANDMQIAVVEAHEDCRIQGETQTSGFNRLRYFPIIPSGENRIRILRGITRRSENLDIVYRRVVTGEPITPTADGRFVLSARPVEAVPSVNVVRVLDSAGAVVREYRDPNILYGAGTPPAANEIRIATDTGEITFEAGQRPTAAQRVEATYAVGHAPPQAGQVLVTVWDGTLAFATDEAPSQTDGDQLIASYLVDRAACVRVSLTAGPVVERYIVPDGHLLAQLINAPNTGSRLATAVPDATNGNRRPRVGVPAFFGSGSNTPGNNGADAGADDYTSGLDSLANMIINIVLLAGRDAAAMGSVLQSHLNATAETDHERIGVIGAPGAELASFLGHTMASDRLIVVAPGLRLPDGSALPPAYMAAAIAGMISSVPVQTSLTNKVVNVPRLAVAFNRGEQEQLIRRNVLAVIDKEGFRVLKGITTAGEGTPFSNIPIRRIVDFAKYGVRSAANSYIGRLNNARVRAALKATLDAFLTRMVEAEALTAYELEVSATRAQEIAGEVNVVMTLQPTFSIDFIRVTMILR
jgi:hypothetical protein